jgi:hydrogenase expression/formation protein HypE
VTLPVGKIDPGLLRRLLDANVVRDERVVIRPGIGRDVCAIRMAEGFLVVKTDPVTFVTDRIGRYVVHVNANDIATAGAHPRWFLCTVLLPERGTDEELVNAVWADLASALDEVGCDLCGGHTEVTPGLDRPILVGQMLGETTAEGLVNKDRIRPGDHILLTKGVPIEGTAILARECAGRLRDAFSPEQISAGARLLDDPGISVVPEAMASCRAGEVHGMHDPTEGGLATALCELAEAAGCGLRVERERVPIVHPGAAFCCHLGIDPLGTIASGALLICAPPDDAVRITAAVRALGTPCQPIGEIRPRSDGAVLVTGGQPAPMPRFPQDEVCRLLP